MDFTGKNLIGLSGVRRDKVRALIPSFSDPSAMRKRWTFTTRLRAYNGELADEVHEFLNAKQGEYNLKKILLRDGKVIELCFQE